MAVGDTRFLAFSHQYEHNFLSNATDYCSHMFQQRWEAKICLKEILTQPLQYHIWFIEDSTNSHRCSNRVYAYSYLSMKYIDLEFKVSILELFSFNPLPYNSDF